MASRRQLLDNETEEEEQSVAPSNRLESRLKVLESSTTENCSSSSSSSSSSTLPSPLPLPVYTSLVPRELFPAAPRCPTSPCTDTSSPHLTKKKRHTEHVLLKTLERLDQESEMARQQNNDDHRFGAMLVDMLSQIDPEEKTRVKFGLYRVLFEVLDKQKPRLLH
ncbi:hypothetical protein E1301_Tti005938 [Triplophysa tibetana]|uniref:BESS domain-containing protein n=1 Tax=Triplophysa tibetana TaxID=1572043 RepID=A0A5A9PXF0_9TELE|nr:hypothetical protein E1301_Tti005938 [Triplophysa tibetana]